MTYVFDTNRPPLTGPEAIYRFKTLIKSAGWTIPTSSDGTTTVVFTGDNITSGFSSGAGNLANNTAWFRMQDPAGGREFCIQRGTTNVFWKVKYSGTAKFTTGGSQSVMPTASDEQYIIGSSGAFASWMDTDNAYRWNACVSSTAPYGFWMFGFAPIQGQRPDLNVGCTLILDPMIAGTFDPSDTDPAIVYGHVLTSTTQTFGSTILGTELATGVPLGWVAKGTAFESFSAIYAGRWVNGSTTVIPNGGGLDPFTKKDVAVGIPWMRPSKTGSTIPGLPIQKGIGTIMKWVSVPRVVGEVITTTLPYDRFIFGDISFPWNGSSLILL